MEELVKNVGAFLPIVLMFAIFYFLLIRPQQKQQKKRQEMLNNLQKGDRVVTIGGIHGVIKEIHDDIITLKVADNVSIKFSKGGIDHVKTDEE